MILLDYFFSRRLQHLDFIIQVNAKNKNTSRKPEISLWNLILENFPVIVFIFYRTSLTITLCENRKVFLHVSHWIYVQEKMFGTNVVNRSETHIFVVPVVPLEYRMLENGRRPLFPCMLHVLESTAIVENTDLEIFKDFHVLSVRLNVKDLFLKCLFVYVCVPR